ncbi:MAG: hypothetical protein AAF065_01420 [Verrucomicrobiota bacterium]
MPALRWMVHHGLHMARSWQISIGGRLMLEHENSVEWLIRIGLLAFLQCWGLISMYHFLDLRVVAAGGLLLLVRLVVFLRFRLPKDLAKISLWSYWDVSYTVIPAFSLTFSLEGFKGEIMPYTVFVGQLVLLCASAAMFVASNLLEKNKKIPEVQESIRRLVVPRVIRSIFVAFVCVSFLLTLLVVVMGIAEMGTRTGTFTKLPFKLEGLINVSRNLYIPILYVFFVYLFSRMQERNFYVLSIAALFLWAGFEMYVRFSKGFLFVAVMPLVFLFIHQRKLKLWMLVLGVTGVLCWVALYPYIGILRSATQSAVVAVEDMSFVYGSMDSQFLNSLDKVMRRICTDAIYMQNVLSFHGYGQPSIEQIGRVVSYGGEAIYYTRVVLGSNVLFFSAGMSGVPGAYMMYGYVGIVLCVVTLSFLSCWGDRLIYSHIYGNSFNRAIVGYLIYTLASTEFFATFYKLRDFMEFFVTLAIVLLLSKRMSRFENPRIGFGQV